MTREEAIQVLESMKSEENYNALIDLCDMAIEALKKEVERQEMVIRASERHLGLVKCKDCRHLDVWNLKNIYAVCSKHGITFEPFEDDTRTHFCSWGERKEE